MSFNEAEFGHDGNVGEDWRSTLWTEISFNRLTSIASAVERLKLALNRNCRFRDSNVDRESRSTLLLTILAMAHHNKGGISSR
jgi:hypothetical protein